MAIQRFENFSDIVRRTRGTRLELNLLKLPTLTLGPQSHTAEAEVSSPLFVIQQLRSASAYFAAACASGSRPSSRSRLAPSTSCAGSRRSLTPRCGRRAPARPTSAALILGAAGVPVPVPIPLDSGVDVSASGAVTGDTREETRYTADGEQVFAVRYRKVQCSIFSTAKVDRAYLERGNRWKSYLELRGAEAEAGVDDGVDAELAEAIAARDLTGKYESCDFGEEKMLYRAR